MNQREKKKHRQQRQPSPAPRQHSALNSQSLGREAGDFSHTELYASYLSLRGPLPPPQILEHYDKVVPGGAERIVGWVEKQSAHRQLLEQARIRGDLKNEARGQWFALIVTLATLAASTFLIWQGKDVSGISLIVTELAALAGVFVYGREAQKREREKIRKEMSAKREQP